MPAELDSYWKMHPDSVKFIIKTNRILHFCEPIYSYDTTKPPRLQTAEKRIIGAVIKSPYIIGGSNLVLMGTNSVLYEIAEENSHNNYIYNDGAICYYKKDFLLIYSKQTNSSLEQGILLSGNFSWNYYHLLYEIIAKCKAISETDIDIEIPLLIDKKCTEIPQFMELFNIFNTGGRKYEILEFGKRYLVKELYWFSSPNLVPPHFLNITRIKSNDFLYDLSVLDFLRTSLLQVVSEGEFPSRIFITRSNASGRRAYNEDEVFQVLVRYGFVKISPEDYSITEQVKLFNQADLIAGGSGAAYANLLFCKRSCKVLCFTNYKISLSLFSTIAAAVGFELIYFHDLNKKLCNSSQLHDSFKIDINLLNSFLSDWLEDSKHSVNERTSVLLSSNS